MTRRSFQFAALCSGALLLGTLLGGASNLPSAHAKSAAPKPPAAEGDAAQVPAKDADPNKNKGGQGAVCKQSSDCQPNHACMKVGDRKECTALPVKPMPVVT